MSATKAGKRLPPEERDAALQIAELLADGFGWDRTPHGGAYWKGVYLALLELAGECRPVTEPERCASCGQTNCPRIKDPNAVLTGMNAMGHSIGFARRQAAYDACLSMGFGNADAMSIVNEMAGLLERNRPHEAMDVSVRGKRVDITGAYRLFAHLLTPAPKEVDP